MLRFFKDGNAILLINIVTIGLLVWVLTLWAGQLISVKMVSLPAYVAPKPNTAIMPAPAADYSAIKHRNLFYPLATQSPGATVGELPISSLPYKLVGTILSHNTKYSAAILEAGAKEQNLYRINDSLLKGAFITQINRYEVIVSNNGRLERIPINFGDIPSSAGDKGRQAFGGLPSGTQVSMLGDNQVVMDKGFFETQKSNMNQLLTNIRAVPNTAPDGTINGFELFEIVKDSLYDKIGLKNKDVVQRVNGQALTSMEGGLDLFNALKNDNHFVIDVMRNNQSKTLTVDVQ